MSDELLTQNWLIGVMHRLNLLLGEHPHLPILIIGCINCTLVNNTIAIFLLVDHVQNDLVISIM